MASGGSSGRSFDLVSDDVLCSYDDYKPQQDPVNGNRSDQSAKDFRENRSGRSLVNVYGTQESYPKEDVVAVVDKCMKKYADNLLQFLEGIGGRLSQLELHCYKLERSVGEFRSDMVRDQSETDRKLNSLEKHINEVHRSVQILRDKQELVETQKELAKLQLEKKESSASIHSQKNEGAVAPSVPEPKTHDNPSDPPNHQLALVPRQATAPPPHKEPTMQQPTPPSLSSPQDLYLLNQAAAFYGQHHQVLQQDYVQPKPQVQDQPPFPQYQMQWAQPQPQPQPQPQQFPMQMLQPQQSTQQPQVRSQAPPTYPPYPHQPTNLVPDSFASAAAPYNTAPQAGGNRAESATFTYGGPGAHNMQQRQPQPQGGQNSFGPYPLPPNNGYNMVYGVDGGRGPHTQNFQQVSYPQNKVGPQQSQQLIRDHPYRELIEKAVNMGYPVKNVLNVIQRMGETLTPVDFNALLDGLNGHGGGGASQRGWSG